MGVCVRNSENVMNSVCLVCPLWICQAFPNHGGIREYFPGVSITKERQKIREDPPVSQMGARFWPPRDGQRPSKAKLEPQDAELGAPTETHFESNQGNFWQWFKLIVAYHGQKVWSPPRFRGNYVCGVRAIGSNIGLKCSPQLVFNASWQSLSCFPDRCLDSDVMTYDLPGSCRSFLVCDGSESIQMCCPYGTTYHSGLVCLPDDQCRDPCPLPPSSTTQTTSRKTNPEKNSFISGCL